MRKITVNFGALLIFTLTLAVGSSAQTSGDSNASNKKPDGQQQSKDRPIKIIKKPVARTGNCADSYGKTTVRATFDKSGTITKVEIVKSSDCGSFDENALKAAREIKFTPATKDGEPVTVTKMMQYSFSKF